MLKHLLARHRRKREAWAIRAATRHLDPHLLRDIGLAGQGAPARRHAAEHAARWL